MPETPAQTDDKLLCYCMGVTFGTVRQIVRDHGCKTVEQVTRECKAGGGCRSCHPEIEQVISEKQGARKSGGIFGWLVNLWRGWMAERKP